MNLTAAHVHRWRFAEPNGPKSTATCDCGQTRESWNTLPMDRSNAGSHWQRTEGKRSGFRTTRGAK